MNILIIAPHPDDESIGCGGAAILHAQRGDRVCAVFLTSGEQGLKRLPPQEAKATREAEARQASAVLGLQRLHFLRLADWGCEAAVMEAAAALAPILAEERPERILLPYPGDGHPDHRASLPIVAAALPEAGLDPELRGYEIWTPMPHFDFVEDISGVMERKLEAIACHRSQVADIRYDRAAAGLNQYRGALAGRCDYAEVQVRLDARFPG